MRGVSTARTAYAIPGRVGLVGPLLSAGSSLSLSLSSAAWVAAARRRRLMNKDIVEKTLNEQKYRMLKKLVYLKLGSGRRCLMNKNIVERTLNNQKYRGIEKLYLISGNARRFFKSPIQDTPSTRRGKARKESNKRVPSEVCPSRLCIDS